MISSLKKVPVTKSGMLTVDLTPILQKFPFKIKYDVSVKNCCQENIFGHNYNSTVFIQ